MGWSKETSRGHESAKVRWDVVPYVRGTGLDIGCGGAKALPHMIGVDARPAPGVNVVMDASQRMPLFASESLDFVFSSHFLEHVKEPGVALAEWWRTLKVGGHLVLYLPLAGVYPRMGEDGANPDHKHDFEPADVIEMMHIAGKGWTMVRNEERTEGNEYSFLQVYRKEEGGLRVSVLEQEQSPTRRAGVVRPGVHGDAIMASTLYPALADMGFTVTAYLEPPGEEVTRHDPYVEKIVTFDRKMIPPGLWAEWFAHEKKKYERWINLIETAEGSLLPTAKKTVFFMPKGARQFLCNRNYTEFIHAAADVPFERCRQGFEPTEEERDLAQAEINFIDPEGAGVVMIAPSGSTLPKFWPHYDECARLIAEADHKVIVVGDLREDEFEAALEHPNIHVWGTTRPLRHVMTVASKCDAVIGEETGVLHSVAMVEDVLKVVLLSHSSHENLTKHWLRTAAMEPQVECHPCHRLIASLDHCAMEETTGAAACQAAVKASMVAEFVLREIKAWG